MRASRLLPLVLIFCVVCLSASSQQTTSTSGPPATSYPQAITFLQQGLAAMTGDPAVTDVTMAATVTVNRGFDRCV